MSEKEWLKQMTPKQTERNKSGGSSVVRTKTNRTETKKSSGFMDVAGMDELKQFIIDSYVNVLNNRECAKAFRVHPPNILFYGPAGCGKTYFAEKTAEELGINFMKVIGSDIASTYVHGTQEKIRELFRAAERKAPTLLFFDELDAMAPSRNNRDNNYQNGETNEFLCMLNNSADRGVYVMAATNHPDYIDSSLLRTGRIDKLVYVDLPDEEARKSLFRYELSKLPVADDIDFDKLANITSGYNCSDISYIVSVASRKMFNASIKEKDKPYQVITQEVLEQVIQQQSPSVTNSELKEYERLRWKFSPKDKNRQQSLIGFHI